MYVARNALRLFEKLLLMVVLMELFLGGGGRLMELGELTLRMYLFAVCMGWVILRLAWGSTVIVPQHIWKLLFQFLTVIGVGALIGVAQGASLESLGGDLKPLMYFPMIMFFAISIRDPKHIATITFLLVSCGIMLSLAYLFTLVVVHGGIVQYPMLYHPLNDTGEFFFRGDDHFYVGFFYKGFLYLCITLLFLLVHPIWRNWWLVLLVLTAIILTFTRGFLVSLVLTLVYGAYLTLGSRRVTLTLLLLGGGTVIASAALFTDFARILQRAHSDNVRLADLQTVWNEIDVSMLLFGKGLGVLIGGRERIEMTYVEILFKQGILGLAFWAMLLKSNYSALQRVTSEFRGEALAFHLATVFVYIQTATNPFLNNPIGMSMVLISTVVLTCLGSGRHSPHRSYVSVVVPPDLRQESRQSSGT